MKAFRSVEIETCCICGEEFDKLYMHEVFTGRRKYICQGCWNRGNSEMDAKHESFRSSYRGKTAIAKHEKNK